MWSGDKDAFKPSKLALLKKKELLQQLTLRVNIFHCNVSLWTLSYTNSIDILSQPYSGVFSLDTEGGGTQPETWWKVWERGGGMDEHESTGRERWRWWGSVGECRSVEGVDLRHIPRWRCFHTVGTTFWGLWGFIFYLVGGFMNGWNLKKGNWDLKGDVLSEEVWRIVLCRLKLLEWKFKFQVF